MLAHNVGTYRVISSVLPVENSFTYDILWYRMISFDIFKILIVLSELIEFIYTIPTEDEKSHCNVIMYANYSLSLGWVHYVSYVTAFSVHNEPIDTTSLYLVFVTDCTPPIVKALTPVNQTLVTSRTASQRRQNRYVKRQKWEDNEWKWVLGKLITLSVYD